MGQRLTRYPVGATLGVFAASWLVLFLTMSRELNLFDEGLVLVDAVRTLRGDVVHRDFYAIYGPAMSWVLAGLFRLDPHWFLLARAWGTAAMAGCVAGTYAVLATRVRWWLTIAGTAAALIWVITSKAYLYPIFGSSTAMFIAAALLLLRHGGGGWMTTVAAGVAIGVAALFRYDLGAFIAFSALLFVAWSARTRGIAMGRDVALVAGGIAIIAIPPALAFLAVSPWQAFYADVVDYGARHYAANRGLPFPRLSATPRGLTDAAVYLPALALIAGVWGLRVAPRHRAPILLFGLLTAFCFLKGFVRVSTLHMIPALLPAGVLLAFVVDGAWADRRERPARWFTAAIAAAVFALPLMTTLALSVYAAGLAYFRPAPTGQTIADRCPAPPYRAGAQIPAFYWPAIHYLRANSRPGEPVLAALPRHDRIYINSIGLNFLLDRPPASHWAQMDPGMQTRADIQTAMVGELARQRTRWIIRDGSFENANEPNASARSSGVLILDRYIAAHYRPVARFGRVDLWLIKSQPAPSRPPSPCA